MVPAQSKPGPGQSSREPAEKDEVRNPAENLSTSPAPAPANGYASDGEAARCDGGDMTADEDDNAGQRSLAQISSQRLHKTPFREPGIIVKRY